MTDKNYHRNDFCNEVTNQLEERINSMAINNDFSDDTLNLLNSMMSSIKEQTQQKLFFEKKAEALEEYVDTLTRINNDLSWISEEALKICDGGDEKFVKLTVLYAGIMKKSSSGGRNGRPYQHYENEIKLALDKYLDATSENRLTLDDVASAITDAIYRKSGEMKEPSETQIITWKKKYKQNKRSSIY